ncbi:MAG: F0F1 ATP synthase subunit delta [Alphaproteobacteria bacterium]|nr:F0F1 ATP synthase subunit delta [Alphaproteobacteria bacterium]
MASKDANSDSLAGRYANALYELAQEEGQTDAVGRDLAMIRQMIAESEDLRRLVRSPVFSREEQGRAIGALLERAGVSALTHRFVLFVASQRRLFALADMARAFAALVAMARGEMTAEVTSAQPLNPTQIASLKASLKAAYGRDVSLETRVDPGLIGGLIVQAGSRMVDSSIRTKLANLAIAMKGA